MSRLCKPLGTLALALGTASLAGAAEAPAPGLQMDYRLGLGGFAEGGRDLGLGTADPTTEGYVDAQAAAYWRSPENWGAFLRAQAFAPSGELTVTDDDQPRRSESYLRLRELWFEYNGFTSYPGELLRVGLQRLRDPDGLWFDRNIESLRWIFDTTLLQGHVGVAESLLTWRSDGSEPEAGLRDRTYAYGGLGTQWRAGHFLGARTMFATDHAEPAEELLDAEPDPKRSDRRYTWIDLYAHNGYYQPRATPGWSYSLDATALVGQREDYALLDDDPLAAPTPSAAESQVRAWATDLGLRWRLPTALPLQLGAAYAFGSGSDQGDLRHRYEQTGLHSNQSRFTGTRSPVHRFNGALQAEQTNLHVGTVYLSVPAERWDASLVYSKFARHRAGDPIVSDGIGVQPEPGRKVLGEGLDLVLAYYFSQPLGRGHSVVGVPQEEDDLRSNLRLRASLFDPNIAFPDAADPQYALRLELTLWL